MNKHFNSEILDNTGACLSFACAIHCLAMPLLVVALPLLGLGFLASEPTERVLLLGAIVLAVGSITWGIQHHRQWRAFLILLAAMTFIGIAKTVEVGSFEVVFHSLGAVLLAAAHLLNRYLCRTCPACEKGE